MTADTWREKHVWEIVLTSFCINPAADMWVRLNAAPLQVQVIKEDIN